MENKMTEEEFKDRFMSTYQGATVFIDEEREKNTNLPDNYDWDGPIPKVDEIIHITFYGCDGYARKLRVIKIVWSAMVKESKYNGLSSRCEIMTEEL